MLKLKIAKAVHVIWRSSAPAPAAIPTKFHTNSWHGSVLLYSKLYCFKLAFENTESMCKVLKRPS